MSTNQQVQQSNRSSNANNSSSHLKPLAPVTNGQIVPLNENDDQNDDIYYNIMPTEIEPQESIQKYYTDESFIFNGLAENFGFQNQSNQNVILIVVPFSFFF